MDHESQTTHAVPHGKDGGVMRPMGGLDHKKPCPIHGDGCAILWDCGSRRDLNIKAAKKNARMKIRSFLKTLKRWVEL